MPTYQYSCTECGHFFEQFQSFSEDSLTVCPQCEGRLRKVFNAVGVVFKGSGFYRTDSRSSSETSDAGSSSSGTAEKAPAGGGGDAKGSAPAGTGSNASSPSAAPAPSGSSTSAA